MKQVEKSATFFPGGAVEVGGGCMVFFKPLCEGKLGKTWKNSILMYP